MACGMTSNHDCSHLRLSFFIIYSVRKIGNLVRNMSCLKCRVLFRPVHVRFQCGFSEVKKEKSIPYDISIKNIIWWASHLIIWILTFQWVVGGYILFFLPRLCLVEYCASDIYLTSRNVIFGLSGRYWISEFRLLALSSLGDYGRLCNLALTHALYLVNSWLVLTTVNSTIWYLPYYSSSIAFACIKTVLLLILSNTTWLPIFHQFKYNRSL